MYNWLKKISWVILLVIIAWTIPGTPQPPPKGAARVVSIEQTISSGMCIGYCIFELRITGTKVTYRERPFPENRKSIPDKRIKDKITKEEWDQLLGSFDIAGFRSMPDTIGCPGCVDEPIQTIEISFSDGSKKSVFSNAGGLPGITDLTAKLDSLESAMREKLKRKYPKTDHFPNPD